MRILSDNTTFSEIFIRLTKENEGQFHKAIVVYGKRPHIVRARVLTPFEREAKGYAVEAETVTWRHYLHIDLWLVEFDFTFETDGRNTE